MNSCQLHESAGYGDPDQWLKGCAGGLRAWNPSSSPHPSLLQPGPLCTQHIHPQHIQRELSGQSAEPCASDYIALCPCTTLHLLISLSLSLPLSLSSSFGLVNACYAIVRSFLFSHVMEVGIDWFLNRFCLGSRFLRW